MSSKTFTEEIDVEISDFDQNDIVDYVVHLIEDKEISDSKKQDLIKAIKESGSKDIDSFSLLDKMKYDLFMSKISDIPIDKFEKFMEECLKK